MNSSSLGPTGPVERSRFALPSNVSCPHARARAMPRPMGRRFSPVAVGRAVRLRCFSTRASPEPPRTKLHYTHPPSAPEVPMDGWKMYPDEEHRDGETATEHSEVRKCGGARRPSLRPVTRSTKRGRWH